MTKGTTVKTAPLSEKPTEVGNYFVANYPPFSSWNEGAIDSVSERLTTSGANPPELGLYFHIPFCRKRCHFCYFRVYTDKNAKEIGSYLDAAVRELEIYAGKRYLNGRHPGFVYFGGGTPSYLSVRQLETLAKRLQALFPWDRADEITFECEPGTLSGAKLKTIREIGTSRLSLGVENFDDKVLEINGRAHRSGEVYRAYEEARALDFPQINIDLIAGMMGESESNWKRCVDETISLAPDSVTIYQMEIPYNTTVYRKMREAGRVVAPVADWPQKRAWVRFAFEKLEENGYTVTSGYTAVRDPEVTRFVYRDRLWTGADLLALGVASFGHLGGLHYQNQTHFAEYIQSVESGNLPYSRACGTNEEERIIRELILQMKIGSVSISYFREKFGVEIVKRFEGPFSDLVSRGFVNIDNDRVRLEREGLLRVDSLLSSFFLPQHQSVRYT